MLVPENKKLLYMHIPNLRKLYCAILEIFKCTPFSIFFAKIDQCLNYEKFTNVIPSPSKLSAKPEIVLADVALLF